jgi:hypothetical protein
VAAYYHVLVSFQDEPKTVRCLFADLSEKELRTRFVAPYRRGKDLLCGTEVVAVSRIRTVGIVRTADTSDIELKRIQEKSRKETEQLNRSSTSVVFLDLGRGYNLEDVSEASEDVTSTFILGPPGHGDRWTVLAAVLNNPWISGIGAGLILAALLWWFGWN